MMRCIDLAKNGIGTTYPNPLVGSVIVYKDEIIGEGWHYSSGMPHAEVNAIQSVKDKSLLKNATIYVSLEPCSHYGKTPPCADLIIENEIKNVVIGSKDPNPKVAGKGIEKLKNAGCKVFTDILKKECDQLNKRFFTFYNKKRPYIILKWAETKDGFIAPLHKKEKVPAWISNTYSRQLVHKWRAEEQAILVGTNTVIDDNPSLTTRDWTGSSPIRVLLDKELRIPDNASVFDSTSSTLIINEVKEEQKENLHYYKVDFNKNMVQQISDLLYKESIQSIIIEGGKQTLQTFIDANLWDEARVFIATTTFKDGIEAPSFSAKPSLEENIHSDKFLTFYND